MTYSIHYTDPKGFQRRANALSFDTEEDARAAIALALAITKPETRSAFERLVETLVARDQEVSIQKNIPQYSNLLFTHESADDANKSALELAPMLFDRLDEYHHQDLERLDMNTACQEGIIEFADTLFPVQKNYWNSGECDAEPATLETYDEEAGGYLLPDRPGHVIDPDSVEGEQHMKEHKIECTRFGAMEAFDETLREFEAGHTVSPERTAGNIAYWLSLWFTPESRLRELASEKEADITEHARSLLGLSEDHMEALMNPKNIPETFVHARPAHVATVLRNFAQTGDMSWNDVASVCSCCEYA